MLTDSRLRAQVDLLWDKLWTGGLTNPLDSIEQLSFLVFLKRLDDVENSRERGARLRQQTCHHHRTRTDSAGQQPGKGRDQHDGSRPGHGLQSRFEGRGAENLLHVEGQEEDRGTVTRPG